MGKKTEGICELLDRHYPDLVENIKDVWKATKEDNETYFKKLKEETEIFTKNLKANPIMFKWDSIWVIVSILLVIVPYYISQTVVNPDIGIQPLAGPINIAKEFAFSNVRHEDSLNRIWHLWTNPLIFVSQTYLLDQTPSLFGLSIPLPIFGKFKFNAGGFYLSYLALYSFYLDTSSGFVHLIYLLFFYSLVPSFGKYVNRLVGPKAASRFAFAIYIFAQGSQILYGHLGREDFYDWNFYQLFHVQQLITVWNIQKTLNFFPYLEETEAWEPIMAECMGKINFSECVM